MVLNGMNILNTDGTVISIPPFQSAIDDLMFINTKCWNAEFVSVGSFVVIMLVMVTLVLLVWQPMSNYFASVDCFCFWFSLRQFFFQCFAKFIRSMSVRFFLLVHMSFSLALTLCVNVCFSLSVEKKTRHKSNDIMIMIMSHHWVECGWKGISKMNACICTVQYKI